MQIPRVKSLLQGISDARRWLAEHIPVTQTMAGYDLFLLAAARVLASQPLHPPVLRELLHYDGPAVDAAIADMIAAGLLVEHKDRDDRARDTLLPTALLIELLNQFSNKFESIFISRQNLRDEQLLIAVAESRLHDIVEALYDHFYDLGWLYLHNWGSSCFLMASLVKRAAESYGYQARIHSCYVEICRDDNKFMLGAQGFAKPGQIDGHAVCIIDERIIVDFGLGNVRRGYRRDFLWAIACLYQPKDALMGGVRLPNGETVLWKDDWQSPDSAKEIAGCVPYVEALYGNYQSFYRRDLLKSA
jgi:DNA-binding MarR family transcriptional regulator